MPDREPNRRGPRPDWTGLAVGRRLWRAARALGRPAPAPRDLLPLAARLAAQGYLNDAFLAAHPDWLVPAWMRAQDDPAAPGFRPRAHSLLNINLTERNWTAIGLPGYTREALVDPRGLITPIPDGPSLDCWLQADGGPVLAASTQPASAIRQRMQGRLPVVATAFESGTLRLSTEAWVCRFDDDPATRPWVAVQAVVFNSSDDPARGHFYFAVRPFNPEGVAPITSLAYSDQAFVVDGRLFAVLLPPPHAWDCDPGAGPDLAATLPALARRPATRNPAGLCHAVAAYAYAIAPWEEAEFLAFLPLPVESRESTVESNGGWAVKIQSLRFRKRRFSGANPKSKIQNPKSSYALLKGLGTGAWQARLDAGVQWRAPDARLEESWTANVGHLLVLHDGDSITPGPATYHQFWIRDAAYMLAALATAGYGQEAWQVLGTYPARQHRDGRFVAPAGEWDATGQALWTMDRVSQLAPDRAALAALWPAARRGAAWILRARREPRPPKARGLLPAGWAAKHFGPPDYYYWDDFWALAGLEAIVSIAERLGLPNEAAAWRREARAFRADLDHSLAGTLLASGALPAAPGRRADSGMIGVLAAWYPLALSPATDPRLPATLQALGEVSSYDGMFYQRIVHHGWGTYLNMHIAECLLRLRSPAAFARVTWLLNHATPTYTWPEAIHPRTGGGSMGDGAHGWASASWLLLLRDLLLFEEGARLVLLAGLPAAWLARDGAVEIRAAPTAFGPVTLHAEWDARAGTLRLAIDAQSTPPAGYELCLPGPVAAAELDGQPLVSIAGGQWAVDSAALPPDRPPGQPPARLWLPAAARTLTVRWGEAQAS